MTADEYRTKWPEPQGMTDDKSTWVVLTPEQMAERERDFHSRPDVQVCERAACAKAGCS